ncbi:hypothetical protein [Candidatus Chlorohelix sp.]|uniref:hypothetical protein n=1 Tax=Candidatus Chlorohelix sp. TaxID=3139201 RepID=UPI003036045B
MARNEATIRGSKAGISYDKAHCNNCGSNLEPIGNRLFLMYKRAQLPQPNHEAWVCVHCGWVEGDTAFQALLEDRINSH